MGLSLANYAQKNQQKTKFKKYISESITWHDTETCMYCQKHFLQPSQLTDHFQTRAQNLKKGGGETEKVCMHFATLSNIVVHTISQ